MCCASLASRKGGASGDGGVSDLGAPRGGGSGGGAQRGCRAGRAHAGRARNRTPTAVGTGGIPVSRMNAYPFR
jgi:hypothetical protein